MALFISFPRLQDDAHAVFERAREYWPTSDAGDFKVEQASARHLQVAGPPLSTDDAPRR